MISDLIKGDKAYMLTKSVGAPIREVHQRKELNSNVYATENIVYNGHRIKNAIVAYFVRKDPRYYIFSYNKRLQGGDYYHSLDFVTEKDLIEENMLPDYLFDL